MRLHVEKIAQPRDDTVLILNLECTWKCRLQNGSGKMGHHLLDQKHYLLHL